MLVIKYVSVKFRVLFFIFTYCFCFPVVAEQGSRQMPPIPSDPTESDCIVYSQNYHSILADMQSNVSQCMRQRPVFGTVMTCRGMSLSAWSQCESKDLEKCQFEKVGKSAVDQCFSRARAVVAQNREHLSKIGLAVEKIESVRKKYEKAKSLAEGIRDPKSYLIKELQNYPNAREMVLGKDDQSLNSTVANDIYGYVFDAIKGRLGKTSNPIVKSIQLEALEHLTRMQKKTFQELDRLSAQLTQFNVVQPASNLKPSEDTGHHPDKDLCRILETC